METIDTAPKNGKLIVVCDPSEDIFMEMYWNKNGQNYLVQGDNYGIWETLDGSMTWSEHNGYGPTHWYEKQSQNVLLNSTDEINFSG